MVDAPEILNQDLCVCLIKLNSQSKYVVKM
jgi:hypothetical protein